MSKKVVFIVGPTASGKTALSISLAKKFGGEIVKAGNILVRQRGTKVHPGNNVGIGSDDTLYAKVAGYVKFERVGRDKKQVSIYEEKVNA